MIVVYINITCEQTSIHFNLLNLGWIKSCLWWRNWSELFWR